MSTITFRLTRLHQRLGEQTRFEAARRVPDSLMLLRLKRLRLRVKDRLHALMQGRRRPA